MGIWGVDLYDCDITLDVKDYFEESFFNGVGVEQITKQLISMFSGIDTLEEPLFWFALADIQWTLGVLSPNVRDKALRWMCENDGLGEWQKNNLDIKLRRKKVLSELRNKLLSPQPIAKSPKKSRCYKCKWKIGDIFAYKLESELAKKRGFFGRYLLIQKIDEIKWYPEHTVPIVYIKITKDENIPKSKEEYENQEYLERTPRAWVLCTADPELYQS